MNQELGIGAGHDFSLGFFYDLSGNDFYRAKNLSFGCGSANGLGIFWDNKGNDKYEITDSQGFGCAVDRVGRHSLRNRNLTTGLFLDAEGKNSVQSPIPYLKGIITQKAWRNEKQNPKPLFSEKFFIGGGQFYQSPEVKYPDGVSINDSKAF